MQLHQRAGDLLARVNYAGERFIIERHGEAVAGLVSIDDLHRLEAADQLSSAQRTQRQEALTQAQAVREAILARRGDAPSRRAQTREDVCARSVRMPSRVCMDINIALQLVLPEVESANTQALWAQGVEAGTEIVAPPLFLIEGTSVLRTQVHRGLITPEESQLLLRTLHAQQVQLRSPEHIHERALTLALRFGRSQAKDAHYLALVETLQCEFCTADARLYRRVGDALHRGRWLGAYEPIPESGGHPPP